MQATVDMELLPSWGEILDEAVKWGATRHLCTTFNLRVRVCYSTTLEFLRCDEIRFAKTHKGIGKKMKELIVHLRKRFCDKRLEARRTEMRFAAIEARLDSLEARTAPAAGSGGITANDLLEAALVMERGRIAEVDLTRLAEILKDLRAGCGNEG